MVDPQLGRPSPNHVLRRPRQLSGGQPGGEEKDVEDGMEGNLAPSLVALKQLRSWPVALV